MDTLRILAIDDVHLGAPREIVEALESFYTGLIGLHRVDPGEDQALAVFRGYPRSGPRLIVRLAGQPERGVLRRDVLIQVASLGDCAERMLDSRMPCFRYRGWTLYDQRATTLDPAGNRVELVAFHPL